MLNKVKKALQPFVVKQIKPAQLTSLKGGNEGDGDFIGVEDVVEG